MGDTGPFCGFFFVLLFIGAIVALAVTFGAAQKKLLREAYGSVARKYRGQLHEGGWFDRPSVAFHYNGTWVRVDIHSTGGKHPTHYTQVHMGWPDPGFRMEVYPEGFLQAVGKFLGMHDIEIGSPRFDREYVIKGGTPQMLRDLLDAQAQGIINTLRGLGGNDNIYVAFRNHELLIKKLGMLKDASSLRRLTELSLQLLDCFSGQLEKGIEFIDAPPSQPAEETMCQVCGDAITGDLVFCNSCKTAHHHDCWQYYGKCSTFGCGERRCYRPRTKRKSRRK